MGCWRTLSSSSAFLLRIQSSSTLVSDLAAVSIASIAESHHEICTKSHSCCLFRNAVSCLSASIDTAGTLCQQRNLPHDGENRTTVAVLFVLHLKVVSALLALMRPLLAEQQYFDEPSTALSRQFRRRTRH